MALAEVGRGLARVFLRGRRRREVVAHDRRHRRVRLMQQSAHTRAHAVEPLAEALAAPRARAGRRGGPARTRRTGAAGAPRPARTRRGGGRAGPGRAVRPPRACSRLHPRVLDDEGPGGGRAQAVHSGARAEGQGQAGQGHEHVRAAQGLLDALQLGAAPVEVAYASRPRRGRCGPLPAIRRARPALRARGPLPRLPGTRRGDAASRAPSRLRGPPPPAPPGRARSDGRRRAGSRTAGRRRRHGARGVR